MIAGSLKKHTLARNTVWMLLGQGLRLVIQAFYFVEIARSLGVHNYGAFVGVVALVGIAFPFGALGSGNQLVQNVSRDKTLFANYWGRGLVTTAVCSFLLFLVVLLVSSVALPSSIPLLLVALVGASDLFALNIIGISGQAFQTFDRLHWMAGINVAVSASRLAGAMILIGLYPHPSALQWGYIYCGSTMFVALISSLAVTRKLGKPDFAWKRSASEIREGFYFSAGLCAQTVYNDIDKTMLVRLGTLDATGIYGAAYRIVDVTFAPISALLAAAYPGFFRAGETGVTSTLTYAKRLLPRALVYSLSACLAILLCANVVPYILGSEYARTVEALRWLAVLPVLKALHYFLSDTLTGAGYQVVRTVIQTGVAIFNVLINLWLIPAYSWRGAAWSSIASDALLACAIATAVFFLARKSQRDLVDVPAHA